MLSILPKGLQPVCIGWESSDYMCHQDKLFTQTLHIYWVYPGDLILKKTVSWWIISINTSGLHNTFELQSSVLVLKEGQVLYTNIGT